MPVNGQVNVPLHGPDSDPSQEHAPLLVQGQEFGPVQGQVPDLIDTGHNISFDDNEDEPEVPMYVLQSRPPPEGCDLEETFRKQPVGQAEDMSDSGEETHREVFDEETLKKTSTGADGHWLSCASGDDGGRSSSPAGESEADTASLPSEDDTDGGQSRINSHNLVREMPSLAGPVSTKETMYSSQITSPPSGFERSRACQSEINSGPRPCAPRVSQWPPGVVGDPEQAHPEPTVPQGQERPFPELVLTANGAEHREPEENGYQSSNACNSLSSGSFVCGPEDLFPGLQHASSNGHRPDSSDSRSYPSMLRNPREEKGYEARGQAGVGAGFRARGPPEGLAHRFLADNNTHAALLGERGGGGGADARPRVPLNNIERPWLHQENGHGSPFHDERHQFAEPLVDFEVPQPDDARMAGSSNASKMNSLSSGSFVCGPEDFLSGLQHASSNGHRPDSSNSRSYPSMLRNPREEKGYEARGQAGVGAGFRARGPPEGLAHRFLADNNTHAALLGERGGGDGGADARPRVPLNNIERPLLLRENGHDSPFQDELRQFAEAMFVEVRQPDDARMAGNDPVQPVERNGQPAMGRDVPGRRSPQQHAYHSDEENMDSGIVRSESDSMDIDC